MTTDTARESSPVRALGEALGVTIAVTGAVTVVSALAPDRFVAALVALVFLGASWLMVWRRDDKHVEASGLALGGVVLPGKIDRRRLARAVLVSIAWAAALSLLVFVPFYFGWKAYWRPQGTFALRVVPLELANEAFGQLVIIALPEEAFYRGYLQSRLDAAFPRKINVLGAPVGLSLLVTSVLFAAGHYATIREPARLAVFFPSLLFGWLRARAGAIGPGVAFHASCNVFSELLGKGFRVY